MHDDGSWFFNEPVLKVNVNKAKLAAGDPCWRIIINLDGICPHICVILAPGHAVELPLAIRCPDLEKIT